MKRNAPGRRNGLRDEDFRFALKAGQSVRIRRERWRQNLDGNLTLQLGVRRPVDLAHAAFADLRGDFVDTEADAGSQGQVADYMGSPATCPTLALPPRRSHCCRTGSPRRRGDARTDRSASSCRWPRHTCGYARWSSRSPALKGPRMRRRDTTKTSPSL